MKISQEIQEKLKTLCDGKTKIVIKGFNDLGDPFETKGRIARYLDGEPVIGEAGIGVEFGNRKTITSESTFVALYNTDVKLFLNKGVKLIIDTIELENGEVLLKNEDTKKYLARARNNFNRYERELKEKGRWNVKVDSFLKELYNYLGKPINFDGVECILSELPRESSGDNLIFKVLDGDMFHILSIYEDSGFIAVNLDTDEEEFICEKNKDWLKTYEFSTGRKIKRKEINEQVNINSQPGSDE